MIASATLNCDPSFASTYLVFSNRISTKSLAVVCRSLGTLLDSGVPIVRAVNLAGDKVSDARCKEAMHRVGEAVAQGDEVSAAMRAQGDRFPELMIQMVDVAEQTGALPEILKDLAEHFENNLRLRRDFISSITWPAIQFGLAVLIIAFLIWILGWIANTRGGETFDILGFGLSGTKGAVTWLAMVGGGLLSLFLIYQFAARSLEGKKYMHGLAMKIPVVGNCMRSFAIARFSWAYYLTQQTGMPVDKSVQASLRATGNGVFIDRTSIICRRINEGEPLAAALREAGIFPDDYLSMVDVAEESGTVPEALHRLSPQFQEDARRTLSTLTTLLGWCVWLMVAAFIIFLIFRIALFYVGMINGLVKETY